MYRTASGADAQSVMENEPLVAAARTQLYYGTRSECPTMQGWKPGNMESLDWKSGTRVQQKISENGIDELSCSHDGISKGEYYNRQVYMQ